MLAVIVALAVVRALSLDVFVIASLVGLLVLTELTAPVNVAPRWRARLKWVLLAGLLVFGYIMARRFLDLVSTVT